MSVFLFAGHSRWKSKMTVFFVVFCTALVPQTIWLDSFVKKMELSRRTFTQRYTSIHKAGEETKRIAIQANLSPDSLKSISAFSQAFAESEKAVLEAHAEKQKSLLQNYHHKFCNMLDKNQGAWLSPTMCKVLLWIFCPCVVVTIVVITLAISMALGK